MAIDMITSLANQFSGPVVEDLGKRLGLPPQMVKAAAPMITGLVIVGVKRLAASPGGKEKVASMMQDAGKRTGDQSLDAFVQEADPAKSVDMLNSLTGSNSTEQVIDNLARKTGLDPQATAKLMGVMAPAVMGQLNGMAKAQNLDIDGMMNLIDQNADALKGLGNLDYILDDVPGISDDIKRGFNKLFGG